MAARDLGRRDRGVLGQLLLVVVRIVRIELALGQRDALAVAADLLEALDAAARRSWVATRATSSSVGPLAMKSAMISSRRRADRGGVLARLHVDRDVEDADAVEVRQRRR